MVFITGDKHGEFSSVENFCKRFNTTKDDILIVLGDAGINFYLNKRDKKLKQELSKLPITLFCIHGNHEERPYNINGYQEKKFNGGTAYVEETFPSIIFAKDGEIYDFNGYKCMVIGGAYSVDKWYRLASHLTWFPSEQPNQKIKQYVESQLSKNNWEVDIVLSHTAPIRYEPIEWFLSGLDQSSVDKSTEEWLGEIEKKLNYKKWYVGHYHGSKKIDKMQFMFNDFDELNV